MLVYLRIAIATQIVSFVTSQASYIECVPGDLNVIVSAPHGGYSEPTTIPDRTAGCLVNGKCVWDHVCGTPDHSAYVDQH